MIDRPRNRSPLPRRLLICAAIGAGAIALVDLSACSRPLLALTDERSPFDRYDNVRGRYAPQYVENEYGRREPNLRGRLSPKD